METMKAVVLEKVTAAKDIKLSDVEIPKVCPGWVLVRLSRELNVRERLL